MSKKSEKVGKVRKSQKSQEKSKKVGKSQKSQKSSKKSEKVRSHRGGWIVGGKSAPPGATNPSTRIPFSTEHVHPKP